MAKTLTVYLAADLKKFSGGLKEAETGLTGFSNKLSGMVGPALIGAAAAAGAFATKLAIDGVKAAVEDEAAAAKLANTLNNLGLAHDTKPVEAYIYQLERSLGVADTELRPAYDRLVRSIGNTEDANKALALSLDIAAGTGKSLDSVVQALGRAYDGNTAGLSRLGAGIDAATLKTGDMEAITRKLSETFAGQATVQARTFEGQMQRLQTAVDNLAEAFGAGLLGTLEDSDQQTQTLVDTMEDLEPVLQRIGDIVGSELVTSMQKAVPLLIATAAAMTAINEATSDTDGVVGALASSLKNAIVPVDTLVSAGIGLGQVLGVVEVRTAAYTSGTVAAAIASGNAVAPMNNLADAVDDIGSEAVQTAYQVASMAEALAAVGGNTFNWRKEINGSTQDAKDFSIELNWNAYQARRAAAAAEAAAAGNKSYSGSASSAGKVTDELTDKQKKLTKAYEASSDALDGLRDDLSDAVDALGVATDAWGDYYDGVASGLGSAIDLGKAYEGQFDKEGKLTGLSLYEGFTQQVQHLEWFGNVLKALKQEGADPGFISAIAQQGAGIGGALGEQLLGDSMVKEMSDQWVNVQDTIDSYAADVVPSFLTAGVESAQAMVTSLAGQVDAESKNLTKLGRQIAKPVGAGFKAQIAADVLEAVRAVEAAQTSARAEKVAQATAAAQLVTEQQVAQAVQNVINRADARTGTPRITGGMGVVFT